MKNDEKEGKARRNSSAGRSVKRTESPALPGFCAEMLLLLLRERTRLVNECARLSNELFALSDMTQLVGGSQEQDDILDKIHDIIGRILDNSASAVFLYQEGDERFVPRSVRGLSADFVKKASLSLSDPLIEEMMSMAHPLIVSRLETHSPIPLLHAARHEKMRGFIGLPIMIKNKFRGMIAIFTRKTAGFSPGEVSLFSTLANQAGLLLESASLYKSALKQQRLVEQLLGKMIHGQEEAYKNLALELHDSIAQSLVGVNTRLNVCRMMMRNSPEAAESELTRLQNVVGELVLEVRNIMFALRPATLDDLGLIPTIENYCKRFEKEHDISIRLRVKKNIRKRLPEAVETTAYRLIQEALNNISKHSGARNALIVISLSPAMLSVVISDDGSGFDVSGSAISRESFGLWGMKERVSFHGGTFALQSEKGAGTTIEVNIPIPRGEKTFAKNENRTEHGQEDQNPRGGRSHPGAGGIRQASPDGPRLRGRRAGGPGGGSD
jgi:signal transduction histidine kinase